MTVGLPLWYCLLCGLVLVNVKQPARPLRICDRCGCREFGLAGYIAGGVRP